MESEALKGEGFGEKIKSFLDQESVFDSGLRGGRIGLLYLFGNAGR